MVEKERELNSVEACKREIEELKNRNKILEGDKHRAAELGLQFMKENKSLKQKLEKVEKEITSESEKLVEENYCLKARLTSKEKLEQEYDSELESIQQKFFKEKSEEVEALKAEGKLIEDRLRRKVTQYEKELLELRSTCNEGALEMQRLARELERAKRRARLSDDSLASPKINASADALRLELARIQEEREMVSEQKDDMNVELKNLRRIKIELQDELDATKERAEKAESMSREYKTTLDDLKEQYSELQFEFETLKSTAMNPARKGNSMFSELDDQRIKVEGELLTVKRQKVELETKCAELQKEVDRLKRQVATALQLSNAGRASVEELHSLQDELERTRGELRVASARLAKKDLYFSCSSTTSASEIKRGGVTTRAKAQAAPGTTDGGGDSALRDIVDQLQKDNEKLRLEGNRLRLEIASCQDELIVEQKRCGGFQMELQNTRNEALRTKLKLQEHVARARAQATASTSAAQNNSDSRTASNFSGGGGWRREKIPSGMPENLAAITEQDSLAGASFMTAADEESSTLVDDSRCEDQGSSDKAEFSEKRSDPTTKPIDQTKKTLRISPEVHLMSESGTLESAELNENDNPDGSRRPQRRVGGKKVNSRKSIARPELDTSAGECKQQ